MKVRLLNPKRTVLDDFSQNTIWKAVNFLAGDLLWHKIVTWAQPAPQLSPPFPEADYLRFNKTQI